MKKKYIVIFATIFLLLIAVFLVASILLKKTQVQFKKESISDTYSLTLPATAKSIGSSTTLSYADYQIDGATLNLDYSNSPEEDILAEQRDGVLARLTYLGLDIQQSETKEEEIFSESVLVTKYIGADNLYYYMQYHKFDDFPAILYGPISSDSAVPNDLFFLERIK